MGKIARLVLLCAVVIALSSAAYCVDVYPTVSFAFNPATYEYAWTVNYTSDVNVNFTTLLVYASVPALCWTSVSGAWSGSPQANENWTFTYPPNGDGTYSLRWYGLSAYQRKPSGGPWTGVFKITIPNSEPIVGNVRTYSSAVQYLTQSSYVPRIVPEPSSLAALGGLAGGLVPFLFRRRKS